MAEPKAAAAFGLCFAAFLMTGFPLSPHTLPRVGFWDSLQGFGTRLAPVGLVGRFFQCDRKGLPFGYRSAFTLKCLASRRKVTNRQVADKQRLIGCTLKLKFAPVKTLPCSFKHPCELPEKNRAFLFFNGNLQQVFLNCHNMRIFKVTAKI